MSINMEHLYEPEPTPRRDYCEWCQEEGRFTYQTCPTCKAKHAKLESEMLKKQKATA